LLRASRAPTQGESKFSTIGGHASIKRLAVALAAILAVGLPSAPRDAYGQSQEGENPQKGLEDLTKESMDKLMKALQLLLEAIPQYEKPTVNEKGDIIIRRKRAPAPKSKEEPAPDDETKT